MRSPYSVGQRYHPPVVGSAFGCDVMTLGKKVLLVAATPVVFLGVALTALYYSSALTTSETQVVEKSRAIVLAAESAREEMADKWHQGIFTVPMLREWGQAGQRDKVLATVPVVTAWRAAMKKADEGGYQLRVPKFQPRNPKNQPDETEARVLKMFEAKAIPEYYELDRSKNAVRYFRPIRLTEECMLCHGEPSTSQELWGNDKGLDPTGAKMEGWKVGEVHGAFEVVQSMAAADASRMSMIWNFVGLLTLCLALGLVGMAWFMRRQVIAPLEMEFYGLSAGAAHVVAAAHHVANSSQFLAQGATEQAASLEETSASMEEMASMTRRNADHSRRAADLMNAVDDSVKQSNVALSTMVQSMKDISDSSAEVSKIIKTIDEIAFQTNILALNAAVEAARAGEAGMGFAVVADEVRSLAQRSAGAAKTTADLIETSVAKSNGGQVQVESVSRAISEITQRVSEARNLISQVSEASHQQSQGIDQVASAIQQMEKVTQQTAATSEETAAASEETNAQAEMTMDTTRRLQALIGVPKEATASREATSNKVAEDETNEHVRDRLVARRAERAAA